MSRAGHTLLIACIITSQGAGLLFAQSVGTALVSMSSGDPDAEIESPKIESAIGEDAYEANYVLSYLLKTSPAKLSLAKLAAERGGCEEIRDFGSVMMKEQDAVTKKVKALAGKRSIYPPHKLDTNSAMEFVKADKSTGFDKKFVEHTISILEADVEILRRATECECRWVRFLASEHLALVEHQLGQLKFIRENTGCD